MGHVHPIAVSDTQEFDTAILNNFDVEALRADYEAASPTSFFVVDDFLDSAFAAELAGSYPTFSGAVAQGGKQFMRVNEDVKVQLTRSEDFSPPVARLHRLLSSKAFLEQMSAITGIPNLLPDPDLKGAGMHLMGRSGNLGVHVDFNFLRSYQLFRRVNLLVYLTPNWQADWGGELELWDKDVRRRLGAIEPVFNRCAVFNTTRESFHGVKAIRCPKGSSRNSFAVYYYTAEPPPNWGGEHFGTIYLARPNEWWKRLVQMPLYDLRRRTTRWRRDLRARLSG